MSGDTVRPKKGPVVMISSNATETITVEVPSVFTYTDNDFRDDDDNPVELVIDLATVEDASALVRRGLLYGWGRSLNDSKGSSDTLTVAERMSNQAKRLAAILSNTWTVGGGGGAKADPLFTELRAILQIVRKESANKVVKAFKTRADVVTAYGATQTEIWEAAAKESIALRAKLAPVTVDVDGKEDK